MRPSPQPLEVSHIPMTSRVPLLPTDISVGALWGVIPVGTIMVQAALGKRVKGADPVPCEVLDICNGLGNRRDDRHPGQPVQRGQDDAAVAGGDKLAVSESHTPKNKGGAAVEILAGDPRIEGNIHFVFDA